MNMMSVYDIRTSHLVDSYSTNKLEASVIQNGGLPVTLAQALFIQVLALFRIYSQHMQYGIFGIKVTSGAVHMRVFFKF